MAGKQKFSNADIIEALKKKKGMVYLAARLIGCHPDTIFKRARRSKAIQSTIKAARGEMIDNAELKLDSAIAKGEPWAVAFALKTIGKQRGYVERQEVSGADGGPIEIDLDEWKRKTQQQLSDINQMEEPAEDGTTDA